MTTVELAVSYDDSWPLDSLAVGVGEAQRELEVSHVLRVLVPDDWAGTAITVDVWGIAGGDRFAHGSTSVVPILAGSVTGSVTLARTPCGDWCTLGATQCADGGVTTCEQKSNGCVGWGSPATCPESAPFCSLGVCGGSCIDECAVGETRCAGPTAVRRCGEADGDSCHDWLAATACGSGETCSNGACTRVCQDECTAGETACLGTGTVTCADRNNDGCLEWGPIVPCAGATTCSNGACSATCTDECSTDMCQVSALKTCGNFDLDPCKELSPGTSCVSADPCKVGTCGGNACEVTAKKCDQPPASTCVDGNTKRTWDVAGTCGASGCEYTHHDTACAGCPSCGGTECNPGDLCLVQPDDVCSDPFTLRRYTGFTFCSNAGTCDYPFDTITCPLGCENAACKKRWNVEDYSFGGWINALWGAGATDVYAVGSSGRIRHSTGNGTWTAQTSGVTTDLFGLWGSSASDVYAVGVGGKILHSTGNGTWTAQTSGVTSDLHGVWGSSASDVYAVGVGGKILHSTGNGTWTAQTSGVTGTLNAVWGSGSGDVFVGGGVTFGPANLVHSTGNGTWTAQSLGFAVEEITAFWGTGPSDVYMAIDNFGSPNAIGHYGASATWVKQIGKTAGGIWGSSASDIYAVGSQFVQHSTGNGTWTEEDTGAGTNLLVVWGTSSSNVYLAGQDGIIVHKTIP